MFKIFFYVKKLVLFKKIFKFNNEKFSNYNFLNFLVKNFNNLKNFKIKFKK